MSKWPTTSLRGKIHVKHGFPFKGEHFQSSGTYVVLTPGNFHEQGGFKRNAEKDKCYSETFPEEYLLKKGDIVVAMTEQAEGLLGSTALIPESGKFLHNQRLGLITAQSGEVLPEFIYHLFKTFPVRDQIRRTSSGSKVKHTSPERIYDVHVPLPPVKDQAAIAEILTTIETKIALNQRINLELEGMAKLLYDYWFVQYDFPLSAAQAAALGKPRLAGQPYRTSGGKMVFNPQLKREIPKGWVAKELSDIAEITMGQSPPGNTYNNEQNGVLFFQGSTDFGWRYPSPRQYTTAPTRMARKGDILLSVRAPVGTLNIAPEECAIGRGLSALRSKSGSSSFLFQILQNLQQVFVRRNGDGTTFGSINRDDLRSLQLAYPSEEDIIHTFDKIVSETDALIFANHQQNQQLTALRDWLLPMLMNGQVRVTE